MSINKDRTLNKRNLIQSSLNESQDIILSPNFKAWFKNSKVVDEQGRPLKVYRGVRRVPNPSGFKMARGRATPSFTADPEVANVYANQLDTRTVGKGSNVVPVYLSMQNPLDIRNLGENTSLYDLMNELNYDWQIPSGEGDVIGFYELEMALDSMDEIIYKMGAEWDIQAADSTEIGRITSFEELSDEIDNWAVEKNYGAIEDALYDVTFDCYLIADSPNWVELLQKKGYDGIIHHEVFDEAIPLYHGDASKFDDEDTSPVTYRPFDNSQIKSIFNKGTFSPEGNMSESISILQNPNFRRWFGDSKVSNKNGPIIVYHGTQSNFTEFDITKHRAGFVGPGFYFTSSKPDVNKNYSTLKGGDVTSNIEKLLDTEELEEYLGEEKVNKIYYDYCMNHNLQDKINDFRDDGVWSWKLKYPVFKDYIIKHPDVLENHLSIVHQGSVMPCYLRMEKPCLMGFGNKDTFFNYEYDIDDEDPDNPEASGDAVTVLSVMSGYEQEESSDHSYADLYDYILDHSGIDADKLRNFIANGWEYEDEKWYMQPFKEILQDLGYDGIIMNAKFYFGKHGKQAWSMKNVQQALHYIVWESTQIKSAIGNKGTYDLQKSHIGETTDSIST